MEISPPIPSTASIPLIMVVAVLYKCGVADSESVSSLLQILNDQPDLGKNFSLILYDNSPQPQLPTLADSVPLEYVHDPANGGLASAYNFALARAEAEGCEWLLLLDQDTSLTGEFLVELVEAASQLHATPMVGMIVPKLVVNGVVHSPAIPFLAQMRRQFQDAEPPLGLEVSGILQQPYAAYNSGSTLRVSALRSAGGFPEEFWLDFLDHAIFAALLAKGYRVYLMLASLVHHASYADIGSLPHWRMSNVLSAQTLFVKQHGNFVDRLLYRIWLLRHSRNLRQACKDPRVWKEAVRQAVFFRRPTIARSAQ